MKIPENIVLIGMPAAGKSTVGVCLAKLLGYDYLDTDILIQRTYNARLEDLIRRYGDDGFLKIEENVCSTVHPVQSVIATGGSVVYSRQAMEHLGEIGLRVYLQVKYKELLNRLGDLRRRGVVLRDGQSFLDLYTERTALYERYADLTVEEREISLDETIEAVHSAVTALSGIDSI